MSDEKAMQCSITGGLFDKGVFAEFHMPDNFKVSNRKMIVMEVEDYDALRKELEEARAIMAESANDIERIQGRIKQDGKCVASLVVKNLREGSESK